MLFFPGPNHLDGYNDLRPEGLIRKDRPTFTQLEIKFIWSEKIIRFSHSWRYYSLCSIWIEINSDMVLMKSKLLIIKRCLPKKKKKYYNWQTLGLSSPMTTKSGASIQWRRVQPLQPQYTRFTDNDFRKRRLIFNPSMRRQLRPCITKCGTKWLLIHSHATVEVWEWISNFITHFTEHVLTYPCWDWS